MTGRNKILLAAGGTGGHMFPAGALAEQLKEAGYEVHLATDKRGMAYVSNLTPMELHQLPAATVYGGGLLALPLRFITLILSLLASFILIIRLRPKVIVGFGGYPSFGPIMASLVLQRRFWCMNKMPFWDGSINWPPISGPMSPPASTIRPICRLRRREKCAAPAIRCALPYCKASEGGYRYLASARAFELLIFGGSQGASIFAEIVPRALALMPEAAKRRLRVVHQVRRPEMRDALAAYGEEGIYSEIRDFFDDLPVRMRRSHLMIARSGASTVAEMTALGVPTIFVPLPGSLDQDQAHNVRELGRLGCAVVIDQKDFTAAHLAAEIEKLMGDEKRLQRMSDNARKYAELDATGRLLR